MAPAFAKSAGLTDVGLKREGNEDAFSVDDSLGLYVVADGMGGHLAGEVASGIAVDLINESFRRWIQSAENEPALFGPADPSLSRIGNFILSGIRLANRVIHELAEEHEQHHGMGTTVSVLAVLPHLVISANVGDSRIYLIRDGQIERLSKDHTFIAEQLEMGSMTYEEADNSPLKHVLTRNLGSAKDVDAEIFEIIPRENDRYILCSDGLTDLVSDDEIQEMAEGEDNPQSLCRHFVDVALSRGGHDNTTVVTVFLSGLGRSGGGPGHQIGGVVADVLARFRRLFGFHS